MKKILLLTAILISTTIFGQRMLIPSLTGNAGVQTKSGVTTAQISWTTNSTSATYSPSYINNTGGDLTWETSGAVIIPTEIEGNAKPILSNFRIEDATPTLVHFDASKDISTLTSTGFTISGKTISSITIDGDNLGGYFTVSVAFTFWDNNTIRLESGNGTVHDFTLTHIRNDITEPITYAKEMWVTPTGSNGNTGLSEGQAYATLAYALSQGVGSGAGYKINVKVGTYTGESIAEGSNGLQGGINSPVLIQGYKITPGDITGNYYSYGMGAIDPTELPVFEGTDRTLDFFDTGLDTYRIFRNIGIQNYDNGFWTNGQISSQPREGQVFENIVYFNNYALSVPTGSGTASAFGFSSQTPENNKIRVKNVVVVNATHSGVSVGGANYSLIENAKVYCDELDVTAVNRAGLTTDYYLKVAGNYNIIRNSEVHRNTRNDTGDNQGGHFGHAISVKGDYTPATGGGDCLYNLIESNLAINCGWGVQARWDGVEYNVYKNNEIHANVAPQYISQNSTGYNGFIVMGGSNNTFENNYVHHLDRFVAFEYDNYEHTLAGDEDSGNNNLFKNNIVTDMDEDIMTFTTNVADSNKFYNNTFYNFSGTIFGSGTATTTNSEFKNNIVYNFTSTNTKTGWTLDYNNFYLATVQGTNANTTNPSFVSVADDTGFIPTVALAGTTLTGVEYDYNQDERDPTTTTIGAIRIEDYPTPPSNHIYSGNNLPTFDLSGSAGGTTTITASSNSAFNNLTQLGLVSDEVLTANLTSATDLQLLEIKINNDFTSANLTTLLNLEELTIRSNPSQTSLDLSGNSVLWELYAYDNALTTLDVSNNPLLTTVVISGNDLPSGEIDQIIIDLAAHGLSNGTLNYSGNTGPPTSASYDAYNTLISRGWTITGTVPPDPIPDPPSSSIAGLPIISNFHVKDGEGTKVYFDTNETITATNTTGFTISGQTISNIFINGATETGHYFTISPGVTFWDNNTIRYEGGSNLVDSDTNALANFTLTYIRNDITEPVASVNRYVSVSGSGDGTSEGNAASLSYAISNAIAGQTWWIKAGNYGNVQTTLSKSGTSTSPIKFKGYKNTIGDINANYYDYGVTWSTSEMPTLTGSSPEYGNIALWIDSCNYVFIENLQVTNYADGIRSVPSDNSSNLILKNINIKGMGSATEGDGEGISFASSNGKLRILNSVAVNTSMVGIDFVGNNGLIKNCKVYSDSNDVIAENDYHISMAGSDNIIKDCYVETFYYSFSSVHGIGVRAAHTGTNIRNLIDSCTAVNTEEGIYFRNEGANYNVAKNCIITTNDTGPNAVIGGGYVAGNYRTSNNTGALTVWGGADYNVFENCLVEKSAYGIHFKFHDGEDTSNASGANNIFKNCIISDVGNVFYNYDNTGLGAIGVNNYFYNLTVVGANDFFRNEGMDMNNMVFTNCIFSDITDLQATGDTQDMGQVIFTYNNFYNNGSWDTTYITGTNMDINPAFTGFYIPTAIMNGTVLSTVPYDYNKLERKDPPTIGAVESPTVVATDYPLLSNFRVENATPARVYFDSSESITGSTFTGFTISGKTITNLFINGTNTENHYFTVSSAFTFWDNNTIKYVGGSDIIDIDSNSIFNFTLQHLVNNIAEPTPTRIRYASLLGGGANTGVDAANAWSYSQAGTNAIAGDKVYFLNGNYGAINIVMSNNGTIDAPIWFIGYNATDGVGVTPTGITKSVGMTFNSAKMPLLVGTGVAITVSNTYSIVKNFQTDGYTDGVMPNGRDVAGGVYFDNLYLKDGTYGVYLNDSDGYNFRMKNSYVGDMTALGITSVAESSLLENNFISSSKIVSMDYYIGCYGGINGDGFIIKDNYIQRFPTDSHSGHGVSIRSGDGTTNLYCQDGLIENNTVVNMGQALEARHNETINNVWRNNIVNGGRDVGVGGVGVSFHDGGHYNIFEGGKIYNVESAIRWYETIEDDITGKRNGHSNVFRNIIISDTYTVLDAVDGTGGTWFETIQSNSWENCTFYDSGRLYNASGALYEIDNTNSMTNCIFDNILTIQGTENIVFDHNNFTSGFTATGTNSSTDAPSFVDLIDFVPSNSALKSGTPLTNVKYDASIPPVQRNFSTPTKGAKEI